MDEKMDEDVLSRVEWKLEQEKLKLERERIALERERLDAMRERVKIEQGGRGTMRLSSAVLCSIICLLAGGMLGAFSMSVRHDRNRTVRLQEVMQSLGAGAVVEDTSVVLTSVPVPEGTASNEVAILAAPVSAPRPLQVKTVRPKGGESGSGISLIVIQ